MSEQSTAPCIACCQSIIIIKSNNRPICCLAAPCRSRWLTTAFSVFLLCRCRCRSQLHNDRLFATSKGARRPKNRQYDTIDRFLTLALIYLSKFVTQRPYP